jgi:heat shock protein HslJ
MNTPSQRLVGPVWEWTGNRGSTGTIAPLLPEKYTIEFRSDSRVVVAADCNRGSGPFSSDDNASMSLGPMAMTRAMCPPGSLYDEYVAALGRVQGYRFESDELVLQSGSMEMHFAPKAD